MSNVEEIVNNPRTTGKILDRYKEDKDNTVRLGVARNPNTSPETLDYMKDDENADVRYGVARNSNTTPETLDYMKDDKEWWVRREIAQNSNTTPETLDYMKDDKDRYVRCEVARNPNTTPETLDYMKNDENIYVLFELLENPNVTEEIITELCSHSHDGIRAHAIKLIPLNWVNNFVENNKNLWNSMDYAYTCEKILSRKDINNQIWVDFSKHISPIVRCVVAGSRKTPPNTLMSLLRDTEYLVSKKALQTIHRMIFKNSNKREQFYTALEKVF